MSGDTKYTKSIKAPKGNTIELGELTADGLRSGLWITTKANNVKVFEITYKDGLKDGPYTRWNSKFTERGVYRAGELHGDVIRCDPNDKVISNLRYANGVLEGPYIKSTGEFVEHGVYRAGNLHGEVIRRDLADKVIYQSRYVHGVLQGPFSIAGAVGQYHKGQLHGTYTKLDQNGLISISREYQHGEMVGDSYGYEDGKLWIHIRYDPTRPLVRPPELGHGFRGELLYYDEPIVVKKFSL